LRLFSKGLQGIAACPKPQKPLLPGTEAEFLNTAPQPLFFSEAAGLNKAVFA
jgi:hypothetical protein